MAGRSDETDFSLADGRGYMLDRSHAAACRLNLQFYLWKDALNFNCHPSIPIGPSSTIADVATGTAIWPIEVAREWPGAQLDCFDIDLAQAPHPQWLPSNITLRRWNIFDDVPTDLVSKYDFVHVRLLVLVIQGIEQARQVIRNLQKLLKPGGFLQWDELDCVNMHVKKISSSVPAPALDQIREMSWSNGRHDWTVSISNYLAEEGFTNSNIEYYGDKDDMIRAFNEQHLLTMEEFASSLAKIGKEEAALTFYKLIGQAYKESTVGAALCIPRIVCTAQKPG